MDAWPRPVCSRWIKPQSAHASRGCLLVVQWPLIAQQCTWQLAKALRRGLIQEIFTQGMRAMSSRSLQSYISEALRRGSMTLQNLRCFKILQR